ncbi:MAG: thiamine pyrophosphate-dependent dehydrogenase E1 component subunit alpha [Anaerolineales bacterium]
MSPKESWPQDGQRAAQLKEGPPGPEPTPLEQAWAPSQLLEMFWYLLLSRRVDERAWILHRQGKIAFHISGMGHEATHIGMAFGIQRGYDWVIPYYRDLALMLALGLTPREFMLSLYGRRGEPSSGARQMPSHFGLRRANVVSTSAPVATQIPQAAGVAFAMKLKGDERIVLTTIGEGATSQGEWYEGMNWAAVHKLPLVCVVENNIYAISVPQDKQMALLDVADRAKGLGIPGRVVDGNDVFSVLEAMKQAVDRARRGGGPTLIEAKTYRPVPHSSDDDDRSYRSREEVEKWKKRDPLNSFQTLLLQRGTLTSEALAEFESRAKAQVEEAVSFAEQAPYPEPMKEGCGPVYAEEIRHAGDDAD